MRRILAATAAAVMVAGGVSLAVAPGASAETFPIDGCANVNYFVPAGSTVTMDYSGCAGYLPGSPKAQLVGSGPLDGTTFTVPDSGYVDAWTEYAALVPGGAPPWRTEWNSFFFSCGSDAASTIAAGAHPADYADYAAFYAGFPVVSYCGTSSAARPIWYQAVARASADATCEDGYTPSWDTWPNGGTGGFVCNRQVFAD